MYSYHQVNVMGVSFTTNFQEKKQTELKRLGLSVSHATLEIFEYEIFDV